MCACDGMMRFKGSYCIVINSDVNGIMRALLCESVCTYFSFMIIISYIEIMAISYCYSFVYFKLVYNIHRATPTVMGIGVY